MKATGIVRRIDDLGRVVIPKEIRRTMRIREGDPLEIYTDADGEVIFKKYSPMGEMSEFTSQYAEVLYRATNMPVLITDRDHVISVVGLPKREAYEKRISKELEDIMENRAEFIAKGSGEELIPIEGLQRSAAVAFPIVGSGDVTGAVILLSSDSQPHPSATEIKLAQVAASFLGKQTEE
ncbi:MAG: AbrB/MazE/SpoVT family DNA-binding domain-containing protein [Clostridia bacterium]|nr:AbrB/MazE/SpoVT family DNA-binding domain-containing protein [Clostridia bacterium]